MFDKILGNLIVRKEKESEVTYLTEKRGLKPAFKVCGKNAANIKSDAFWDNRGKFYGALFNSLNGRIF